MSLVFYITSGENLPAQLRERKVSFTVVISTADQSRQRLLLKTQGWADANPGLTETKDQDLIRLTQGLTLANLIPVNYTTISLH